MLGLAVGRPEPGLTCSSGCGGSTVGVKFLSAFTNDDGVVNSSTLDPNDNGVDPGYDKRVASCRAWVSTVDKIWTKVLNGYPSYTCRFWAKVRNTGTSTVYYLGSVIDSPTVLTVRDVSGSSCLKLKPGQAKYISFTVHIEQAAGQMATYTFDIEPRFKVTSCGK